MVEYNCAVDDPDTPFSHVAFKWNEELFGWEFLCAGRTMEEFQQRVQYWLDKGVDPANIRKYACQQVVSVAVTHAAPQPQPVEGESWGEWVGRLRSAQNRITVETSQQVSAILQPVLITEELWAVIRARRPGAYETLQKYNVQYAIIKVLTSRTKLEFPVLPNVVRDDPEWQEFDTHTVHVSRPIIVLDGTPENRFRLVTGIAVRD